MNHRRKTRKRSTASCMQAEFSREEAAALELLRSTGVGVLEAAQVACAALRAGAGEMERSLRCIYVGAETLRQQEQTVDFEQAAWASVAARSGRRPTTRRDLRYYVRRLLRIEGVGQLPLRSMSTGQCRQILEQAFGHSAHAYRKGRTIMHSIFSYGIRQEWCDANPVARVDTPEVQETPIVPLNHEEIERLRKTAAQPRFADMRFSLSLLLYSGVRPAEVERIIPDDVFWKEKQVVIRPQSSKTGGGRVVPLRPLPDLESKDCSVPQNWQERWKALRRAAGFKRWIPDVCRHTFASYHAAYFRNLPELQLEMGHRDMSLLRSRYLAPALQHAATRFWTAALRC